MENQCNPQPVVNIDQLKKGNVFEVVIDGNKQHPVVLMEDFQQGHKRIHAVGFSHDDRHNICFPKNMLSTLTTLMIILLSGKTIEVKRALFHLDLIKK